MTTDTIAIDLGARNCRAALFRNGSVEILRNIDEKLFIPSILTIKRGKTYVGSPALNTSPSNVIYDACQEVSASQNDALKCYAKADSDGCYYLKDGPSTGQRVSQLEAIAMLLEHIKTKMAKRYLGRSVDRAVICVPGYAGENYRAVVLEAAQLAGFKDVRFLNQTDAASLAFVTESLNSKLRDNTAYSKFAILSMGANSFEASVFESINGHAKRLAVRGSAHFGGDSFTDLLASAVISKIKKMEPNKEELFNETGLKIIRDSCEKAKVDLSMLNETRLVIDILEHEIDLGIITRKQFERVCAQAFNEVERYIAKAFNPHLFEISNVILVGGSSRIAKLKDIVQNHILSHFTFVTGIVAEEAVITGAAINIGQENAPDHSMPQQQPQPQNIQQQRQSGSQQTTSKQDISHRPPVQQKEQTPEHSAQKSTEFEDNRQTRSGNMSNESEAMLQNPPKNFVPLADCTDQLINLLHETERRVEQLRKYTNQLGQEKESILDILNNVKPTLEILKLEKREENKVLLTVERILKRCKAVDVVVNTPRNEDRLLDDVNKGVQTDFAMENNGIIPETHAVNINVGSFSFVKEALNQLGEAIGKLLSRFDSSNKSTRKEDVLNSSSNPDGDAADAEHIVKKKQKREFMNVHQCNCKGDSEAATTSQRSAPRSEKEEQRRLGGYGAQQRK